MSLRSSASIVRTLCSLVGGAALALGCAEQQAAVTAPSGDQASYAEAYPTKLEAVRAGFAEDETAARKTFPQLKELPGSLKNTDYEHVVTVVERADKEGRSGTYAETAREAETIQRFLTEEKEPLRQKVAGGVNYAAKQKNCDEELGSSAVFAMERGIDKQLEERLHARSDAHRYIEEHQEELGKGNVEALEKHADEIARTSYLVNVRLELHRRELEAMLSEAGSAESTLDRVIRENDAVLADDKATKSRKAVAQRRKDAAEAAKARIDADVEAAQRALDEMQGRITNAQREYQAALDALIEDLEQRAKTSDKPSS